MSAHQHMKKMLDQLMGTGRNGDDGTEQVHFSSQRVCKCFLHHCCPHDILSATRCDLGRCPKLHEFAHRADYEMAIKTKDYNFEPEVLIQLKNFISESERRSQVAKQRLAETQQVLSTNVAIRNVQKQAIDQKIEQTLNDLEKLGEEGKVEESMKTMKDLETFKEEKATMENVYKTYVPQSRFQQQQLRVCTTCSSYLGFDDGDERIADHFKGRMHLGFSKIRDKIDELENYIQDKHIKQFLEKEFQTPSHIQTFVIPTLQLVQLGTPQNPFTASGPSIKRSIELEQGVDPKPKKLKPSEIPVPTAPGAESLNVS